MGKVDGNRQPKKGAFLAAYARCGNVSRATKLAKIGRQSVYNWLDSDPEFKKGFQDANVQACDALELEARRRAVKGTLKPVYQGGVQVGTIREYSDTLLIFLMKGAMPDKYRELKVNHSGSVSHAHVHAHAVRIVEDGDWYGNADNLITEAATAPDTGTPSPGPHEGNGSGPTSGQNGNGFAGSH